MFQNPAFYDAVIAGAGGGAQTSWIQTRNPTAYIEFIRCADLIATAVDGLIPTIVGGPSISQIQLIQSIAQAVYAGRYLNGLSAGDCADIASAIVQLFNVLAVTLTNQPANVVVPPYGNPVALVPGGGNVTGAAAAMSNAAHQHELPGYGLPGASTPGDAAVVGSATAFANAAHQHAMPGYGMPGASTPGDASAVGAAAAFANAAHQHAMLPFGTSPVAVGGPVNSGGILNEYARIDHQHTMKADSTSSIALATGTRNVLIYTVPALPTGNGRFILTRCILRLSSAVVGTGAATVSIGSTSGGTQIVLPVLLNSGSVLSVIAGEALASLGANMLSANGYEAVYNAGQNIYANITVTGIVTAGIVDVYIYGIYLNP
jgi:hypothetical protein